MLAKFRTSSTPPFKSDKFRLLSATLQSCSRVEIDNRTGVSLQANTHTRCTMQPIPSLQPMTVAEYAAYEQRLGARVVEADGIYWRRVRPLFYRPLMPFEPLEASDLQKPKPARWGGYQHGVIDPAQANSTMAFLMFREAEKYQLECLDKKRRWEVRTGNRFFSIRPLENAGELAASHPVYLDFSRRTRYRYRRDRVRAGRYQKWAETVFQYRKNLVLGAFSEGEIQAVSVCTWVGQTLIYAIFFAREAALKRHVASLMLHTIRSVAAAGKDLRQVYVGMRKSGRAESVDTFYLERGCEVVMFPAYYRIYPLISKLLRILQPALWERVTGTAFLQAVNRPTD